MQSSNPDTAPEKKAPFFATLPLFRKDLKIYRGPDDWDGSPTYNLFDPIRGQYYKLSWKESLILRCLKGEMSSEDLSNQIFKDFSLRLETEDIEHFFLQLAHADLLRITKGSDHYQQVKERMQPNLWMWLLYNYLYIRIPLLNPDRFLTRALPYVRPFGSTPALLLYLCVCFTGLYWVIEQFDEFLNTFTYFFNIQGIMIYALAVTGVKLIHEFSHAFVAKRYGLHVPTMGIALIVLWPVLYTDVTDGWKLSKRSQRVAISFAGIAAELVIGGIATLGWVLSNPGLLQSVFFVLASTSWISTLIINLNPAVRFDGYYILCDVWGIDNLQIRGNAVTRWKYFELLLGIQTSCPEPRASRGRITGLVVYTLYTWVYRILLYTGVAVFVYYEFTKALGIVLFFAEILIFMVWPLMYEAREIYMVRERIKMNYRLIITLGLIGLALSWFILPLPHHETFSAAVIPTVEQVLYVPQNSIVQAVHVTRDQNVTRGEPIIDLESKTLLKELGTSILQKNLLEKEILVSGMDTKDVGTLGQKQAEFAKENELYEQLLHKEHQLKIQSSINGKLYDWDMTIKPGMALPEGKIIGKIAHMEAVYAIAYVPETELSFFIVGKKVTVIVPHPLTYLTGSVERIDPLRSVQLNQPGLASYNQGPLPVMGDIEGHHLLLVESYYKVYIHVDLPQEANVKFGQEVDVRVRGPWYSILMKLVRYFTRIYLRESSL